MDSDEACDDGNSSGFDGCLPDCTVVPPIEAPPLEWKYMEVPGTTCLNGETAGFGVSLNPDSKNVMIYLEGGGACFNDSCDFLTFSLPFVTPAGGIFSRDNPNNPVKDWNMVYVPYCTGDIHGGDKETELGGKVRYFRGYSNIAKYLTQWGATFKDAETVLLTGISAGGFGAALNAMQVANAFGPEHQMVMLDDSGPPFGNDVIPPCLQKVFREVWGLDSTVLADCGPDCGDPNNFASGVLSHVLVQYPGMRLGLFSNSADLVIRNFMGFGWGNGQLDKCDGFPTAVPANTYNAGLLAIRAEAESRVGTFFVGQNQAAYGFGTGHTILRSPTVWTTTIDGVSMSAWVEGVISGKVQHVGP